MKYLLSLLVITTIGSSSFAGITYAESNATRDINRESNLVIKNIKNPTGKIWAKNYLSGLTKSIKAIEGRHSNIPANNALKKEIVKNANLFLTDIKNNSYTFDISTEERETVEANVLGYQKDFLTSFKKELGRYLSQDQKETGNMSFLVKSEEANVDFKIESYKAIASKDGKNIELDMKITLLVEENKTHETAKIMIDGSIVIMGDDLYVSLKDYSLQASNDEFYTEDMANILKEFKGKVLHQKIGKEYGEYMIKEAQDNQIVIKIMNNMVDILMNNSLLTPIAKKGNDFILGINSRIIQEFSKIVHSEYSDFFGSFPVGLLPGISLPINIISDGSSIWIHELNESVRADINISRNTEKIAMIDIYGEEVGVKYPWKGEFHFTPTTLRIHGTVADYIFNYTENKTNIISTLEKNKKTIATLKIDNNGFDAWTYDLSGIWDYSRYDWDTDADKTESVVFQFFAKIQAEFGQFAILKPSISQELDKLSYFEKERDTTRTTQLENIAGYLDYYKSDYSKYPQSPKNNCVTSIKTSPNSSVSFDYFNAPQNIGAGNCENGYFYKKIKNNYVLATRVEQRSNANFDNSIIDISTASYVDIEGNMQKGIISNNPSDWYYVITDTSYNNEYDN